MSNEKITDIVSQRICKHMNNDHKEAVLEYAHHYGGLPSAKKAKMISINSAEMKLDADGNLIRIEFDHMLSDSEDAHKTLVSMIKKLRAKTS